MIKIFLATILLQLTFVVGDIFADIKVGSNKGISKVNIINIDIVKISSPDDILIDDKSGFVNYFKITFSKPIEFEKGYRFFILLASKKRIGQDIILVKGCESLVNINSNEDVIKLYCLYKLIFEEYPSSASELVKKNFISSDQLDKVKNEKQEKIIVKANALMKQMELLKK